MAVGEIGLAVAGTAAIMSPRARKVVRQGAVYGLAGALKAGDVVVGSARGAVRGAQGGVSSSTEERTTPYAADSVSAPAQTPPPAAAT